MALVILYQHTNCIDSYCFSFSYFSFSEEAEVQHIHFDVKGLSLFYIFIGLLMFSLLNKTGVTFNIIALILAIVILFVLFKYENKTDMPFYQ